MAALCPAFAVAPGVLLCALWLGACAGAAPAVRQAPPGVHDYYPLRPGSAWSYDVDVDAGDGLPVLAITRVEGAEVGPGQRVRVRTGQGLVLYRLQPDGIVREHDGTYLLKAPLQTGASWPSSGGATARVEETGLALTTAAGSFQGCVRVREQGGRSGAVIDTVYCPRVGPVRVRSTLRLTASEARVEALLRGFAIGGGP